jgi:hypothetical protein
MSQKSGKGDALRKEKALLHTFVAGQKYGVGRDAIRRYCFSEKAQGQQIKICCPHYHKVRLNFVSRLRLVFTDQPHTNGSGTFIELL